MDEKPLISLQWRHNERDGISNHHPQPFIQGADQRKHQSSMSLAFVRGIHRWPVNSPHKGPVTRKMFPFDDIIMIIIQIPREPQWWLYDNSPVIQVMAWCRSGREPLSEPMIIWVPSHQRINGSHLTGHSAVGSKVQSGSQKRPHPWSNFCLTGLCVWNPPVKKSFPFHTISIMTKIQYLIYPWWCNCNWSTMSKIESDEW